MANTIMSNDKPTHSPKPANPGSGSNTGKGTGGGSAPNPTDDRRSPVRAAANFEPPRPHESAADSALRFARSEGLPEERIQEVLRSPNWTPGDLRRAADNYNDD